MIEVDGLVKHYDGGRVKAVDDISFKIGRGEVVGFLGPNGAGKSTTLRMITGYSLPTAGTISIDGLGMGEFSEGAKKLIGYLPESAALYQNMKLIEFLQFIMDSRSLSPTFAKERLEYVLDKLGLEDRAFQTISSLSKGYRQRVGLAQAIIHDPELVVLDEPTSGLDPNQVLEIRKLIKEISINKTVIFSTHALREVEIVCSKVIILNRGKIVLCADKEEIGSIRARNITRVKLKGEKANISKAFGKSEEFRILKSKEDAGAITLTLESIDDIREKVFKIAMENEFAILEFFLEKESLEKVFKSLTS